MQIGISINNEHQTLYVRGSEDGKHKFKDWLAEKLKRERPILYTV